MINSTANTLATALDGGTANYWRKYVGDLERFKYITSKTIHSGGEDGGINLGALYCITEKGAEALEETFDDGEVFYPKAGIEVKSPFMFPHRLKVIEIMAHFLRSEKLGHFEILEMVPHFRHSGSNRLGTGKAYCSVEIPSSAIKDKIIVPDVMVKLMIGGKVRLVAVELHRNTDTARVLKQLQKHSIAIGTGAFNKLFNHDAPNFVFSIHVDTKKLKNVLDSIRAGGIENFDRYKNGYFFGSVSDLKANGITSAFYSIDGIKCKLFDM